MQHQSSISLEGKDWRLGYKKVYDGSVSATIAEIDKMSEWFPATVPGNVRADLMAAERLPDLFVGTNNERAHWVNDCVWWYEKKFKQPRKKFKRFFVELKGIDYLSQIYFNGRKLDQREGMFAQHHYNVTSLMKAENVLSVRIMGSSFLPKPVLTPWKRIWGRIGAPLQGGNEVFPDRIASVKCQMSFGWDFAPDMRTMGVWDEVNLIGSGNVFIAHTNVRASVAGQSGSATLQLRLHLNSITTARLKIAVQLRPFNFEGSAQDFSFDAAVQRGTERIERNIVLEDPHLWNPWDRGHPSLYEMNIKIYDDERLSDEVTGLVGLRSIELARNPNTPRKNSDWTFIINGKREFIRGANWVPADSLMGRLREEDYAELIKMAKEANVNMLRVWGGGLREKRHFYEICSREGILVWQEFPFACMFLGTLPTDEAFLRTAEREVAAIVRSISNHPCVAVYCGGNEFSPRRNSKLLSRLAQVVRTLDNTRPFLPVSPAGGDEHNWFVWHGYANIRDYRKDRCQLASEFGLQAPPSLESLKKFLSEGSLWPPGDEWEYHKAELKKLQRYTGSLSEFSRPEQFIEASQKMQAFALQTAIEHYRRRKYECSGAIFWQLNEPWPAISWSVIDYYRNPKLAYHKLKDVYNPVLASLNYELRGHTAGEILPIEAWIVNDLLQPLEDCKLDVWIEDKGENVMSLSFDVGTVPADSSQPYLQFGLKLPDRRSWLLQVRLRSGDKALTSNSYDLNIWDRGEASLWNRIYALLGKAVLW